jgi:hypothetical protein
MPSGGVAGVLQILVELVTGGSEEKLKAKLEAIGNTAGQNLGKKIIVMVNQLRKEKIQQY